MLISVSDEKNTLTFLSPIDGDVLFEEIDGTREGEVLHVPISLFAKAGATVTVNGIPASEEKPGEYTVRVPLRGYKNTVTAFCRETGEEQTITLFWFRKGYHTYRLGVDDVILCLENVAKNKDTYTSIFDDPFLSLFHDVHNTYGTHVHMHIYYETVDKSFNLSMFPEKYKDEFRQNADWLRFSFHARADRPFSPYKNASYKQMMAEGRAVEREILRFAGAAVMDHVTSQHFADSALPGTRAFRDLGFSVLDGYFVFDSEGRPRVSYYLDVEQTKHAATRDFWVDTKEDIIFVKDDVVLDAHEPKDIAPFLDAFLERQDRAFMYLLIHEQYFYPHFEMYCPDYRERVFEGVRWCVEHGYRSSWISDFAFE